MANEHGLFWNSQNGDRIYDANDFSEWLKKFYTTGVFNGDLEVTAAGGMTVSVSSGYVNIEGKVKFFSTPTTLTLATASGTHGRIDTVVAECNYTDREIKLKVVTGTYSVSPTATAPVRTAAAYQLVLAQIDVAAGAAEITQKNITDKRMDSNVCGLVTGTVSQIDFSTVKAQFDSWFDDVKGTLDTDAAGNLKNQIDDINDKLGSTDISSIGDGTETSAIAKNASDISTLNNGLAKLYPIGSIYLSVNSTNPSTFIGGTWERIKDRFLLAAGDTYSAGATGGEASHKLSANEMPSHNHSASTNSTGSHSHSFSPSGYAVVGSAGGQIAGGDSAWGVLAGATVSISSAGAHSHSVTVNSTGGSAAHNNMPPYLAVYMWVRTA